MKPPFAAKKILKNKIQENKRTLSENILGKNNGNNNKDSKEIFEMDEKELMELLNFEK